MPDDPDATLANINARYPGETQQKRDDLFYNIMSYHQEDRFLPVQMAIWNNAIANHSSRAAVLVPSTIYVSPTGSNSNNGTAAHP